MTTQKTIFIGPFGGGTTPTNGASVKNYHILKKFYSLGKSVYTIDTEYWKRDPKVLLTLLYTIITNPKSKYILSLNSGSALKLIRFIKLLAPKANVIYWVIGGSLGKKMLNGEINPKIFSSLDKIIVEGERMKNQMNEVGLNNVSVLPNFKHYLDVPLNNKRGTNLKFIFLSRIIPQKGCNLILEAVECLNKLGYKDKFSVDFFGPIDEGYKKDFINRCISIDNVDYKGFLDLRRPENYSVLTDYDALLFPTFWPGEGCPGIVMDAYISGLPLLASDWNLNCDYIDDGKTGILYPPQDVKALINAIQDCIDGKTDLEGMSMNCRKKAKEYDVDNVLSERNIKELGII